MVTEYQRRRDVIVEGLNAIPGITCQQAAGCILRLPEHYGHGHETSSELANLILEKAGVACCPARHLANTEKGICGCRTRLRFRSSKRAWPASAPCWLKKTGRP